MARKAKAKRPRKRAGLEKISQAKSPAKKSAFVPRTLAPYEEDREAIPPRYHWHIFFGLLIVAAIMRFAGLGAKDLWFDEIRSILDFRYPRSTGAGHWLFYPIMGWFMQFTGDPTFGARVYPALAGTLTIPLIYQALSRFAGRTTGLIAAAIICFQPFHLEYSQESRFYAPVIFYAAVTIWASAEFAYQKSRWRFLLLPLILAAAYLATQHHPAAIPYMLAQVGWLLLALCFSYWGIDALRQALPPLRKAKNPRLILGIGLTVLILVGAVVAKALRSRIIEVLFGTPWGETPGVHFTWEFFARHFNIYAWDLGYSPRFAVWSGALNVALVLSGLILLIRRRTWTGLHLFFVILAVFSAVFAFKYDKTYLDKYSSSMMPAMSALAGIGLAEIFWMIARQLKSLKSRPGTLAAGAGATVVFLCALPLIVAYYQAYKMPMRPQFRWVNTHETKNADVYVYGHAAYPASFYSETLKSIHKLVYFYYERPTPMHLERQAMMGSAARGTPTYFAKIWPHDMSPEFKEWLKRGAEEVEHFHSVKGEPYDGVLYRILPPDHDRGGSRPAGRIDSLGKLGRPEYIPRNGTAGPSLHFSQSATVLYHIPVEAGKRYRVEATIEAREAGRNYGLGFSPQGSQPVVLAYNGEANVKRVLRGYLVPREDSDWIEMDYLSDFPEISDREKGLEVHRISIQEAPDGEYLPTHVLPFPPAQTVALESNGKLLPGWQTLGEMTLQEVSKSPGGEYVSIALTEQFEGNLLSPVITIPENALVYVNAEIRLRGALGIGGNVALAFFDDQMVPRAQLYLSAKSFENRVEWEPVVSKLLVDEWNIVRGFRAVPSGLTKMALVIPLWETEPRHYSFAENELQIRNIQYSVLSKEQLQGAGTGQP